MFCLHFYLRYKYVNNAFEKFTGFTLEELTGKDVSDIHRSDPQMNSIKEQISKGNVCVFEISFTACFLKTVTINESIKIRSERNQSALILVTVPTMTNHRVFVIKNILQVKYNYLVISIYV